MRSITLSLLAFLLLLTPSLAQEADPALTPITEREDAVALLALYAGQWTARGTSRSNFGDELEAASCRMESLFDAATATLVNVGRCASVQGAVDLDGDLTIDEDGMLTGGYFSRFEDTEILSSDGGVYEEGFILEARYRAEIRSELQEIDVALSLTRPQLQVDGRTSFRMIIAILNPDIDEYVEFSVLEFARLD